MVEELTYPGIKNLARLFGLELAPVAMDDEGLLPEAFEAASRDPAARLLYCMPNVHNPTTGSLSRERREAIVKIAARRGVIVIEDDVNPRGSATTPPAIAELYPERSVYITSLSKTVAPGLRVGCISSPPGLFSDLLVATQTTNWMAPPLMAELACRWIEDGTVDLLSQEHDHIISPPAGPGRRVSGRPGLPPGRGDTAALAAAVARLERRELRCQAGRTPRPDNPGRALSPSTRGRPAPPCASALPRAATSACAGPLA